MNNNMTGINPQKVAYYIDLDESWKFKTHMLDIVSQKRSKTQIYDALWLAYMQLFSHGIIAVFVSIHIPHIHNAGLLTCTFGLYVGLYTYTVQVKWIWIYRIHVVSQTFVKHHPISILTNGCTFWIAVATIRDVKKRGLLNNYTEAYRDYYELWMISLRPCA